MKRGLWLTAACGLAAHGCGGEPRKTVMLELKDECHDRADVVLCSQGVALSCVGGKVQSRTSCGDQQCVDAVGCRACVPNSPSCTGNSYYLCNPTGSERVFIEDCAAGLSCSPGGCADLCADAVANRSYLGCDYWPVFTSNSQLDSLFEPAVAIGNGNLVPAHIVISKGQQTVGTFDVPAGSATTQLLPFEPALKDPHGSRLVRQGAYHLTASVPVTVHQYNPLLFEVEQDCADMSSPEPEQGVCNSYTNDASLLFPSSALKQDPEVTDSTVLDFIAASRASFMALGPDGLYQGDSSFIAVVAVGDQPADVTVTSSAFTMPSPDSTSEDTVESLLPGSTLTRTLEPGDVLQLVTVVPTSCGSNVTGSYGPYTYCDPGPQYDMTGTTISADGPVQVISGHDCTNVPFDRPACDHLEESLVPLHAWGASAVLTVPQAAAGGAYMLRLVSGVDNNAISFDPPLHEPLTLQKNQSIELSDVTQSAVVRGTGRLMAVQYLLGQGNLNAGDPAMSIAVPTDQYRSSYNFISPATYVRNYVDIIAAHDDVVTLDGTLVSTFQPIGQSRFSATAVELTTSGAHEIHGTGPDGIGIVLYGVAPYTAYLLPGGLDLLPIGPIGI